MLPISMEFASGSSLAHSDLRPNDCLKRSVIQRSGTQDENSEGRWDDVFPESLKILKPGAIDINKSDRIFKITG